MPSMDQPLFTLHRDLRHPVRLETMPGSTPELTFATVEGRPVLRGTVTRFGVPVELVLQLDFPPEKIAELVYQGAEYLLQEHRDL